MSHIIVSSAALISSEGWVRVFVNAAQHNPLAVRTMIVVVPGKLPPCHQLPAPLFLTSQPLAYFAGEFGGYAGAGVVIVRTVAGFNRAGRLPAPVT